MMCERGECDEDMCGKDVGKVWVKFEGWKMEERWERDSER